MTRKIIYIIGMCLVYGIGQIFVKGFFSPMLFLGDVAALFMLGVVLTLIIMVGKRIFGNKQVFKDPIGELYNGMIIMVAIGLLGCLASYFDK